MGAIVHKPEDPEDRGSCQEQGRGLEQILPQTGPADTLTSDLQPPALRQQLRLSEASSVRLVVSCHRKFVASGRQAYCASQARNGLGARSPDACCARGETVPQGVRGGRLIKGAQVEKGRDPPRTALEKHRQTFCWWALSPDPAWGLGVGEKVLMGLRSPWGTPAFLGWRGRAGSGLWRPTLASV